MNQDEERSLNVGEPLKSCRAVHRRLSWVWEREKVCMRLCECVTYDSCPRQNHPCSRRRHRSTSVQRYNFHLNNETLYQSTSSCLKKEVKERKRIWKEMEREEEEEKTFLQLFKYTFFYRIKQDALFLLCIWACVSVWEFVCVCSHRIAHHCCLHSRCLRHSATGCECSSRSDTGTHPPHTPAGLQRDGEAKEFIVRWVAREVCFFLSIDQQYSHAFNIPWSWIWNHRVNKFRCRWRWMNCAGLLDDEEEILPSLPGSLTESILPGRTTSYYYY